MHRSLQRHGISRLPDVDGDKPTRANFKAYTIGYFHVDLAEVRTEQGKLYLLVAIDRTSKFAFVELHEKATRRIAADFLRHLAAAALYRIHTVLTDNGMHFTDPTGNGWTPEDIKTMQGAVTAWRPWLRRRLVQGRASAKGIQPCIPGRRSRNEPVRHDKRRYCRRNRIEIMFGYLKDWRRVVTRYDRCPPSSPP